MSSKKIESSAVEDLSEDSKKMFELLKKARQTNKISDLEEIHSMEKKFTDAFHERVVGVNETIATNVPALGKENLEAVGKLRVLENEVHFNPLNEHPLCHVRPFPLAVRLEILLDRDDKLCRLSVGTALDKLVDIHYDN